MDYYVANDGKDSSAGKSTSAPWATVGKLMGIAFQPGDRIFLKRGSTFVLGSAALALYSSGGGTQAAPIQLDAYGDASAPLPVIKRVDRFEYAVLQLNKPWLAARNLAVHGDRNAIVVSGAPGAMVSNCQVPQSKGTGIAVRRHDGANPGTVIKDNTITNCQGTGIACTPETNLTVARNTVSKCCLDASHPANDLEFNYTAGIKIFGQLGATNVVIEGNTVEKNGNMVQRNQGVASISKGTGIWIDSVDYGAVICRGNLSRDNVNSGIMVENCEQQLLERNQCYRNGLSRVPGDVSPDFAGIVLFRGANRCIVRSNRSSDNPWEILGYGYPSIGAEGRDQSVNDNEVTLNTVRYRPQWHQVPIAFYARTESILDLGTNRVHDNIIETYG